LMIVSNLIIPPIKKSGKMQYPKIETLSKKVILPPRTRVLKVTTTAPPKAIKKSSRN